MKSNFKVSYLGSEETDMRLIKANLLYADELEVCDYILPMIKSAYEIKNNDLIDKLDFYVSCFMSKTGIPELEELEKFLKGYKRFYKDMRAKYPEKWEIINKKAMYYLKSYDEIMHSYFQKYELESLVRAEKEGIIKIFYNKYEPDSEGEYVRTFLSNAFNTIYTGESFPLFDDWVLKNHFSSASSNLIITNFIEGISKQEREQIKHMPFVINVLMRLPNFDTATINELIDIRKDLDKFLIPFRAAMLNCSSIISGEVWDKDFPIEVEREFHRSILPCVLAIEEEVKSNKYLSELTTNLTTKPVTTAALTTGLGIIISKFVDMQDILVTALSVTAGLGTVAAATAIDVISKRKETDKNQFYFYYKAHQLLSHSTN